MPLIETKQINDVLPLIDEETWFLVDLDNCLFEGAQALGHAHWFTDELQRRMAEGINREEAISLLYPHWIKMQRVCPVKPLDDDFVSILLSSQKRGITIMGLTHRQSSIADSTERQVRSLGLNFLTTAPSKESFTIPEKAHTLYSHGILFVGDYNKKVDIFDSFLSIIKKRPRKIVFIDDNRNNVEELEALTKYGIEYFGVHYTAIEKAQPIYFREVAEFQYQFLDKIMSNEAALLLMKNGFI